MIATRFAPSPTGRLHVGNLRTAVMNWALARGAHGRFLLRIDDTDRERSDERFVTAIRDDLRWLGLEWDAEARQSARSPLYAAAADRLRAAGRLYPCYETPAELEAKRRRQLATGRPPVYDRAALDLTTGDRARLEAEGRRPHWRFLLDRAPVAWRDLILGPQLVDAGSVSDPVAVRGDGQFLYTFCTVVDDAEMGISHVVRGADHVTNTAAQIQIFAALGHAPPTFAHHSLLTAPGGAALSKRIGSTSAADLRAEGVEPAALVSLMARLGSADPVELRRSPAEAAAAFDIARFAASPTAFDPEEARRLSAAWLHDAPFAAVAGRLADLGVAGPKAPAFWLAVRPNLARLADAADWWRIVEGAVEPAIAPEDEAFVAAALAALPPRPWTEATWREWTGRLKAETGRKGRALFLPLRRALTGRDHGPEMAALMPLLEKP